MSVIERIWTLRQPMFHFVSVILHNIYIVNDSRKSHPGTCSMALKVFNCVDIKSTVIPFHQEPFSYSETSPYGHLGNMFTLLLRPLSFSRLKKTAIHFLVKKPSLIRPFFWAHWWPYWRGSNVFQHRSQSFSESSLVKLVGGFLFTLLWSVPSLLRSHSW